MIVHHFPLLYFDHRPWPDYGEYESRVRFEKKKTCFVSVSPILEERAQPWRGGIWRTAMMTLNAADDAHYENNDFYYED